MVPHGVCSTVSLGVISGRDDEEVVMSDRLATGAHREEVIDAARA